MKNLITLLENIEERQKAETVVAQVRTKIRLKNLFGWKSFVDDVIIDLVGYMISTHFQYSIGAYITCGMQSALDHCRYCNAQCRRDNYEAVSIDDDESYLQIEDESSNTEENMIKQERPAELYEMIAERFGKELAEQLRPVIYDEQDKLDKKVLAQVKTEEFKEFLRSL